VIVNERIRQIRTHKGLSSKQLAERSGLSPAEISRIENESRQPKLDTTERIAAALDVSLDYLAGRRNSDVALPQAMARESFDVFLRDSPVTSEERELLRRVVLSDSAPQSCDDWRRLQRNLQIMGLTEKIESR
jgi:transcriptional regulator with XRE-family HTH domain